MRFDVSIQDHQRLRPFLNRYRNTVNWDWTLRNEIISYDKEWLELLSVDGSVNIPYLVLLKHIAIGGNGYSRRIPRDFNLSANVGEESYNFDNQYRRTRSLFYKFGKTLKTIWIFFDFFDFFEFFEFFSFSDNYKFIPRWSLDYTEKQYMSYRIGQWLASYLSSEIDDVFFLLPYDEVKRQIPRQVRENNQQDPFDQNWDWNNRPDLVGFYLHEGEPLPIVIEAKGYSNKPSNTQMNNWKKQAASSGIQVPYSVVAATYHLYKKRPKCLYKDPKTLPGYNLTNKDYARLLNVYYQPFKNLVKKFKFLLQKKKIQGVEYYVLNLGKIWSEIPCMYNLLECLDYQYPHLDYHYHRNCFSFIGQHNLYLRKDFLYADWTNKIDFSLFKKRYKIQEPNLYIDNDWIWFGIED